MPVKAEPSIAGNFPLESSCGMLFAPVPTFNVAAVPSPLTSDAAPEVATAVIQ